MIPMVTKVATDQQAGFVERLTKKKKLLDQFLLRLASNCAIQYFRRQGSERTISRNI